MLEILNKTMHPLLPALFQITMPENITVSLLLITVSLVLIWLKSDQIPELIPEALFPRTTNGTTCLIYGFPRNRACDEKVSIGSYTIKYRRNIDRE